MKCLVSFNHCRVPQNDSFSFLSVSLPCLCFLFSFFLSSHSLPYSSHLYPFSHIHHIPLTTTHFFSSSSFIFFLFFPFIFLSIISTTSHGRHHLPCPPCLHCYHHQQQPASSTHSQPSLHTSCCLHSPFLGLTNEVFSLLDFCSCCLCYWALFGLFESPCI